MVALIAEGRLEIRAMAPEDIPAVMVVETAAYVFPWSAGIFRDCLAVGHECRVLVQSGRLIGHGVLSSAAGEAHLLNICIAPAAQGMGHGRRLLLRMIDIARWHGSDRVFLEVRPSNAAAIKLYRDERFMPVGRRPGYYPDRRGREDALVMALDLKPGATAD